MRNILTAFFLLLATISLAQNVNIPDAVFKAELVANPSINTNFDAEIQLSEASVYGGGIYVNGKGISDLTGIEAFTVLTDLRCDSNYLTTLDVSANTMLTGLNCQDNQLTTLDVSSNSALNYLDCSKNQISTLDVSANTSMSQLYCYENQLSTINLNGLVSLLHLDVSSNSLTTIDVSTNSSLLGFNCDNNIISSLNLSNNVALEYLSCASNSLTALDVSNNTSLTGIFCYSNDIASIDVSGISTLTHLDIGGNLLTSLNVAPNTALTYLLCWGNQLSTLDVTNNTQLDTLNFGGNVLTTIDLSQNPGIIHFTGDYNELDSLDLSAQSALTYAKCNNNTLKKLTVKNGNNSNLNTFDAKVNPDLVCINVDDENFMNNNWSAAKESFTSYNNNCSLCTNSNVVSGVVSYEGNPINAGVAVLIEKDLSDPTQSKSMDTTLIFGGGTYAFSNVGLGNYIVVAKGDTSMYSNMPTYADSAKNWEDAIVFDLTFGCNDTIGFANIDLITVPVMNNVGGEINGTLLSGGPNRAGDPIPGIDIALQQIPGGIIKGTSTTDDNGDFTLRYDEPGEYVLNIDMVGYKMDTINTMSCDTGTSAGYTVQVCVDTNNAYMEMCNFMLTSIELADQDYGYNVYPNPSKGIVMIEGVTGLVNSINLFDITGKLVYSEPLFSSNNELNLGHVPNGFYFVQIIQDDIPTAVTKISIRR